MAADTNSYPLPSRCWCCGRFVTGSREIPQRACGRCRVKWFAVLPGTDPSAPVDRKAELGAIAEKFRFRPGTPFADTFDVFVDHAELRLASPA